MSETLIKRVLGGVKVVDHLTRKTLRNGIQLVSNELAFQPTSSGAFAITMAPRFAAYTRSFTQIPNIAARQFTINVVDQSRKYLPVSMKLSLPRDAKPSATIDRVDTPIVVELPSANGRLNEAGWTTLRTLVTRANGTPLRGVLVRAMNFDGTLELGWGLSDEGGQAFVPILGVPRLADVAPADGDDAPELTTAITTIVLMASVDKTLPWPANPAAIRAGGTSIQAMPPTNGIALTAGAQVEHRLIMTNV